MTIFYALHYFSTLSNSDFSFLVRYLFLSAILCHSRLPATPHKVENKANTNGMKRYLNVEDETFVHFVHSVIIKRRFDKENGYGIANANGRLPSIDFMSINSNAIHFLRSLDALKLDADRVAIPIIHPARIEQ